MRVYPLKFQLPGMNTKPVSSLSRIANTASHKMQLFYSIRQYFETMGIYHNVPFNWRNLLFVAAMIQLFISTGGFLVLSKSNDVVENSFAFYQATNGLAAMFAFMICIWKKEQMFEMLQSFEAFIEKSEFWYIFSLFFRDHLVLICLNLMYAGSHTSIAKIEYDELAKKIEWMTKLFHTILIKITFPICNLPPLLITLINFYVLKLDDDSFNMQFPIM